MGDPPAGGPAHDDAVPRRCRRVPRVVRPAEVGAQASPRPGLQGAMSIIRAEAEELRREKRWGEMRPSHMVATWAWLYEAVYGVAPEPAEVAPKASWDRDAGGRQGAPRVVPPGTPSGCGPVHAVGVGAREGREGAATRRVADRGAVDVRDADRRLEDRDGRRRARTSRRTQSARKSKPGRPSSASSVALAAAMADPATRCIAARRLKPDRSSTRSTGPPGRRCASRERRKPEGTSRPSRGFTGTKWTSSTSRGLRVRAPRSSRTRAPAGHEGMLGLREGGGRPGSGRRARRGLAGLRAPPPSASRRWAGRSPRPSGSTATAGTLQHSSVVRHEDAGYGREEARGPPAWDRRRTKDERTGESRLAPGAKPGMVTVVTALSGAGKSTLAARNALGQAMRGRRVRAARWRWGVEKTVASSLARCCWPRRAWSHTRLCRLFQTPTRRRRSSGPPPRRSGEPNCSCRTCSASKRVGKSSNEANLDLIHQHYLRRALGDDGATLGPASRTRRPEAEKLALERTQAIAQETQCHLVLLAQQRLKDVEQRADPRPTREGIKGSSSWWTSGTRRSGSIAPRNSRRCRTSRSRSTF